MSNRYDELKDSIKAFKDAIMEKIEGLSGGSGGDGSGGGGYGYASTLDITQSTLVGTVPLTPPEEDLLPIGLSVSPSGHRIYVLWWTGYTYPKQWVQQINMGQINPANVESHIPEDQIETAHTVDMDLSNEGRDIAIAPNGKSLFISTYNHMTQFPLATPFEIDTRGPKILSYATADNDYDEDLVYGRVGSFAIDYHQTYFADDWGGQIREVRMNQPGSVLTMAETGVAGPELEDANHRRSWGIDFAERGNSVIFCSDRNGILCQVPLGIPYSSHTMSTVASHVLELPPGVIRVRSDLSSHFLYMLSETENKIDVYQTNVGRGA